MNKTIIRPATIHDLDALLALEQANFTSDQMTRRHYRHALSSPTAIIMIAELAQTLVGSAVIFFRRNSKKARIYSLAVHTDHRQQGIALHLCHALEKISVKQGCNYVILEVRTDNSAAINFYKKNNYEIFGQYLAYYEDGSDALRMKKMIT